MEAPASKIFLPPIFPFLGPENFCPHFGPCSRWDFLGHFLTHLYFGMVSTGQHSMHDTDTWGDTHAQVFQAVFQTHAQVLQAV